MLNYQNKKKYFLSADQIVQLIESMKDVLPATESQWMAARSDLCIGKKFRVAHIRTADGGSWPVTKTKNIWTMPITMPSIW